MSMLKAMLMGKKRTITPPKNVIFDKLNDSLLMKTSGRDDLYIKQNNILSYGGFLNFYDNGYWSQALFISENKEGLYFKRTPENLTLLIEEQPIFYKGKYWYYTNNEYAIQGVHTTSEQNNRYFIGEYYGAESTAIKFQQAVRDLIDYIYSF